MENKSCNTCKRNKLKPKELALALLGLYMIGMSIYGTIHFIKHLIN